MTRTELKGIFDKYGPMVLRRARYILGNIADAEEACQEVFIRALKKAEGFERRSQVSTWLYRITTNYCINRLRDARRRQELWKTDVVPHADGTTASQASPDQQMLVRKLLAEADETLAKTAVCVYMDGMTHREAAEVLGVSRRTVGNHLERFNEWAKARLNEGESG